MLRSVTNVSSAAFRVLGDRRGIGPGLRHLQRYAEDHPHALVEPLITLLMMNTATGVCTGGLAMAWWA